jgi:hypothetical protein
VRPTLAADSREDATPHREEWPEVGDGEFANANCRPPSTYLLRLSLSAFGGEKASFLAAGSLIVAPVEGCARHRPVSREVINRTSMSLLSECAESGAQHTGAGN